MTYAQDRKAFRAQLSSAITNTELLGDAEGLIELSFGNATFKLFNQLDSLVPVYKRSNSKKVKGHQEREYFPVYWKPRGLKLKSWEPSKDPKPTITLVEPIPKWLKEAQCTQC